MLYVNLPRLTVSSLISQMGQTSYRTTNGQIKKGKTQKPVYDSSVTLVKLHKYKRQLELEVSEIKLIYKLDGICIPGMLGDSRPKVHFPDALYMFGDLPLGTQAHLTHQAAFQLTCTRGFSLLYFMLLLTTTDYTSGSQPVSVCGSHPNFNIFRDSHPTL